MRVDIEADGLVTVEVHPRVWFDLVNLAELAVASGDILVEFPLDSQPHASRSRFP